MKKKTVTKKSIVYEIDIDSKPLKKQIAEIDAMVDKLIAKLDKLKNKLK